jgi:hypothetical protein
MLAVSSYPQEYIDDCRARVDAQLAAYRDLAAAAGNGAGSALAAFAPHVFNNMVLVLDQLFVHRVRKQEGKDGNPLNEVRVLCASLMGNGGVMAADRTIRLTPEASVLHLAPGDAIALGEEDFRRLADAFFDELEKRYGA